MHNLFKSHFITGEPAPNKWVLFTRSSTDLHLLAAKEELQRVLLLPLLDHLGDQGKSPKKWMDFIAFSSISSQTKCDQRIQSFINSSSQQICVCVADMKSVTKNQLNYFRYHMDEKLLQKKKSSNPAFAQKEPIIIILAHFPPERLQLENCYDAVMLNGWNFAYLDSYNCNIGDVTHVQDPRWWFAVSLGLETESKRSMVNNFRAMLDKAIDTFASKVVFPVPPRIVLARQKTAQYVKDALKSKEFIRELILDVFASKWQSEYLHKVVRKACEDVQLGNSVQSLLEIIFSALEYLLNQIVTKFCVAVGEHIQGIAAVDDADSEIIKDILRTIELPQLTDTVQQASKITVNLIRETYQLPLSTLIFKRINAMASEIKDNTNPLESLQAMVQASNINQVVKKLESPEYFERVKKDFYTHYFGIPIDIEPEVMFSVYDYIVMQSVASKLFHEDNKICSLYIIQRQFMKEIMFIKHCFTILPHAIDDPIDAFNQYSEFADIINMIFEKTVKNMYSSFAKLDEFGFEDFDQKFRVLVSILDSHNIQRLSDISRNKFLFILVLWSYVSYIGPVKEGLADALNAAKQLEDVSVSENLDEFVNAIWQQRAQRDPDSVQNTDDNVKQWLEYLFIHVYNDKANTSHVDQLRQFVTILDDGCKSCLWKHVSNTMKASYFLRIYKAKRTEVENLIDEKLKDLKEFIPPEISVDNLPQYQPLVLIYYQVMLQLKDKEAVVGRECDDRADMYRKLAPHRASKRIEREAVAVLLLKDVAKAFMEKSISDTVDSWKATTKEVVSELMKNVQYRMFMLCSINTHTKLQELFTCNDGIIKILYLQDWKMPAALVGNQIHVNYFPFMYDEHAPGNHLYNRISELIKVGNVQQLKQEILLRIAEDQQNMYLARMFFILISYHEYFTKNQQCAVVLQALNDQQLVQGMDINAEELKAFRFVASGPLTNQQVGNSYLHELFAASLITNPNGDKFLTNFLINLLAVALGLPRDKCHVYTRIFRIRDLATSLSPCSTYYYKSWDCGYIADGLKINANGMLNGSVLYVSCLNAITWSSFLISLLWSPENFDATYAKDSHMLNYLQDVQSTRPLNEFEKVNRYIMERANTYLTIFYENQVVKSQNVDLLFYYTQALYKFWLAARQGAPQAKGYFPADENGTQAVITYQNFLRDVALEPCLTQYANLKKQFDENVDKSNKLKLIFEYQHKLRQYYQNNSLFVHYEMFTEALSKEPEVKSLVNSYVNSRDRIRSLFNLPTLVDFYVWIHRALSDVYTKEDIMKVSVDDALNYLEKNGYDDARHRWTSFADEWNAARQSLKQLEGCVRLDNDEKAIIEMDLSHLIFSLLNIESMDDQNHEMYRVIANITKLQNDIIFSHNPYSQIPDFNNLNLPSIQSDSEEQGRQQSMLLTVGDMNNEFEEIAGCFCTMNEGTITIQRQALDKFILERYVNGKPKLNIQPLSKIFCRLKQPSVAPAKLTEQPQEEFTGRPHAIHVLHEKINALKELQNAVFPQLLETSEQKLRQVLSVSKEKIVELAEYLCEVMNKLIDEYTDPTILDQRIEDFATGIQDKSDLAKSLRNFGLKYLVNIANIVVDKAMEDDHLFAQAHSLNIAFHRKTTTLLEQKQQLILDSVSDPKKSEYYLAALKELASVLLDKTHETKLLQANNQTLPIRKVFENVLKDKAELMDMILPDSVLIQNYSPYLRFLQRTCGKLELSMCANRKRGSVYKEKVPADLEETQLQLENEIIELPEDMDDAADKEVEQVMQQPELVLEQVFVPEEQLQPPQPQPSNNNVTTVRELEQQIAQLREEIQREKLLIRQVQELTSMQDRQVQFCQWCIEAMSQSIQTSNAILSLLK
jgi:hypothetical protein